MNIRDLNRSSADQGLNLLESKDTNKMSRNSSTISFSANDQYEIEKKRLYSKLMDFQQSGKETQNVIDQFLTSVQKISLSNKGNSDGQSQMGQKSIDQKSSPKKKSPSKTKTVLKENSPTKQNENSPSKKQTKSPLKSFGPQSELQPFIPDRQSPQKHPNLMFSSMCQPFQDPDIDDVAIKLEPCAQESLYQTLLESRKQNRVTPNVLSEILDLDTKILSYGRFTSGKVLGSTLTLKNKSLKQIQFSIQIASDFSKNQTPMQLLEPFYQEDLPFKQPIEEIENHPRCWSIEQPDTKQLLNNITLQLEPDESQTIVIVLKSPNLTKATNLMSILRITSGQSFVVKQVESGKRRLVEDKLQVILCGRLENPVVFCTKSLQDSSLKQSIIPLAIRLDQPVQKFRLPFVTKTIEDTDFEFIFIKSVRTEHNEDMCSVFDCMVFFCQPSVLKVGNLANQTPAVLNVQLKVDVERLNCLSRRVLSQPLTKLLIARVQGTNLMQSFFVNLYLIEGNANE